MNPLRIALVKQEVYQDLYVCPRTEKDPAAILFSSQGRVGPIGLMAELGADFYIVKEEPAWETQVYRKVIPHIAPYLHLLKTETLDKIPGQEFKQPGSPHANGEFAVDCHTVDWGTYDVVVSLNVSLPAEVVRRYPQTLFAYMIGEANLATHRVHFGYDATLNQMARGRVAQRCGEVDFPYTFLKGDTLERILQKTFGAADRHGVFMEINSTTERPVTRVPDHFKPLEAAGQPILLHRQRIADNLAQIYHAKYFVKMGGRTIRGNSVAEAVSAGALALMDSREVIHRELVIPECDVRTMDEVVALVRRLEADPAEYARLLAKQRGVLTTLFFERPLQSIANCLADKRRRGKPATCNLFTRLLDRLVFIHP